MDWLELASPTLPAEVFGSWLDPGPPEIPDDVEVD